MNIHTPSAPSVRLAKTTVQSAVVVLIVLGAPHAALAVNCTEQPNIQTIKDGHRYYRIDPSNPRKCAQPQPPSVESSAAGSKTATQGGTSLSQFLSSLFSSSPRAVSNAPQQAVATTASAANAEFGAANKSPPSYERRWVLRVKHTGRPPQADQTKSGGEQQNLEPAEREALFQSFLRWEVWRDQAQSFGEQ